MFKQHGVSSRLKASACGSFCVLVWLLTPAGCVFSDGGTGAPTVIFERDVGGDVRRDVTQIPPIEDGSVVQDVATEQEEPDAPHDIVDVNADGLNGEGSVDDGTVTQPEKCDDGEDNDQNGLVDCADDECKKKGFGCFATVPKGWSVYYVLERTKADPAGPDASCPKGSSGPAVKWVQYEASAGVCGTCTCETIGGYCSVPDVFCSARDNCAGKNDRISVDGSCSLINQEGKTYSGCKVSGVSSYVGAACTPKVVEIGNEKKLKYTKVLDACNLETSESARGCNSTDASRCLLGPSASAVTDGWKLCIAKQNATASESCPNGWDTLAFQEVFVFGNVKDERTCDPCSCSSPPQLKCDHARYGLFEDGACSGKPKMIDNVGQCYKLADSNLLVKSIRFISDVGADCTPNERVEKGKIETGPRYAVCCQG